MNIGIFGGSFNPIHVGHAILANYVVQYTDIDKVWLMVARQNPLKPDYDKSYDIHRIRMTEMVSSRLDDVITSGFEFTMPYPSYTIDTLDALSLKFPADSFHIIIGADNWVTFHRWKEYRRIISDYGVLVYPRRGYDIVIQQEFSSTVRIIDSPLVEISSTYIRQQIAAGKNMSFFLPDDVHDYIVRHNLYKLS